MVSNVNKNETLCKEALLFETYQFKPRSHERGNAWKAIAENLIASVTWSFKFDARSLKDRDLLG